jgi:DNA-directed RNA polymerase specialized sigma24 family protein
MADTSTLEEHREFCINYLVSKGCERATAEDLFQAICVKYYCLTPAERNEINKPRAWLFTSVHRAWLNHLDLSTNKKRATLPEEVALPTPTTGPVTAADLKLVREKILQVAREAIGPPEDDYRIVFERRAIGEKVSEIVQHYAEKGQIIPANTMRDRLEMARERFARDIIRQVQATPEGQRNLEQALRILDLYKYVEKYLG